MASTGFAQDHHDFDSTQAEELALELEDSAHHEEVLEHSTIADEHGNGESISENHGNPFAMRKR